MEKPNYHIRQVAVLGAGVMGSQIAAHFTNADIPVLLYDLPGQGNDKNAIVKKAMIQLGKMHPPPFAFKSQVDLIQTANYEDDLARLMQCDLVIEAIAEELQWKKDLLQRITPHLSDKAILATNTSGLSVNTLAEILPTALRERFCGVHFFNPPRYMHLVELIAGEHSKTEVLDYLETFLVSSLGKGIIYAKDTPNFIANRIGIFSLLATLHHASDQKISLDIVDELTGPLIGRPKSATLRTLDLVGLDVFAHTIQTMQNGLPEDPWHCHFKVPDWIQRCIDAGALGKKSGQGIYKKIANDYFVLDVASNDYHLANGHISNTVKDILKIPSASERFAALHACDDRQAQFLWALFRDLFHYSAFHLPDIAESARDVDLAMRWGFAWQQGPFASWQAGGWQPISDWIGQDIASGKSWSQAALPDWVHALQEGVYKGQAAFNPATKQWVKPRDLPVYQRQMIRDSLDSAEEKGETLFESAAVRLWQTEDDIAILSFKSKLAVIGSDVLDGINQAIDLAEAQCKGLILWQGSNEHFSAGANLKELSTVILDNDYTTLNTILAHFQATCLRLRSASIVTVAAVRGYVLGGGCEMMMHCDHTIAAFESYVGLVEAGVGLIPAGGGCKEMALRAAAAHLVNDPYQHLETYFKQIAMASVSGSAREAVALGYLRPASPIMCHAGEILHVAKHQVVLSYEAGYRPPLQSAVPVVGIQGLARLKTLIVNLLAGQMISEHDAQVAESIAYVLCGGEIDAGNVAQAWLLNLERKQFIDLCKLDLTRMRIAHMLKTGKPLRN